MVLKNNFFFIESSEILDSEVCYDLRLNADHFIYKAHFPEEPITPGVCVIQIAKELLEEHLQRVLTIKAVKNVKFLSVISPRQHPVVRYVISHIQIQPEGVKAVVDVVTGGTPMTHLSLTCA